MVEKEESNKRYCDAILKHPDDKRFVMCDLEYDHIGCHEALNMMWFGKHITIAKEEDWDRAKEHFFTECKELIKNG